MLSSMNAVRFGWGGQKPLPAPKDYVVYSDGKSQGKVLDALDQRLYDGGDDNLGFAVVSRKASRISADSICKWLTELGKRQAERVFGQKTPQEKAAKNIISHHAFEAERGMFWNLTPLPDYPGIELAALQTLPKPAGVKDYFWVVDVDQYCKDTGLNLNKITNGAGRIGIMAPEKRKHYEQVARTKLTAEEKEQDRLFGSDRRKSARQLLQADTHARNLLEKYAVKIDASSVEGETPVLMSRAGRRLFVAHPTWTTSLTDASEKADLENPAPTRAFREFFQENTELDSDFLNPKMKEYWRQNSNAFLEANPPES